MSMERVRKCFLCPLSKQNKKPTFKDLPVKLFSKLRDSIKTMVTCHLQKPKPETQIIAPSTPPPQILGPNEAINK